MPITVVHEKATDTQTHFSPTITINLAPSHTANSLESAFLVKPSSVVPSYYRPQNRQERGFEIELSRVALRYYGVANRESTS